jgi:dihydrofolate synthase/folylpolyglutamate synthase
MENAASAVAAIEALISPGTDISAQNIEQGFSRVSWPGRLQILKREPIVVVDGAHNAYSMNKLVAAIKKYFDFKRCLVIFGTSSDKDISGMAQELQRLSHSFIVTSSSHPRAAGISSIAEKFNSMGVKVVALENVGVAIQKALALAGKTDLILVTGSLFVVAEAIDYLAKGTASEAAGTN